MPYSTLKGEGAKVFEKIYNNALKEYNGDKEKAARTAWAGLKQAGYSKNEKGEWVKRAELAELSMTIVKASYNKTDQSMHFRAVASDTEPDLFNEQMTPELFMDFCSRIDNKTPIPENFKSVICEEDWCGGLPYPSIAHYKSAGGQNVPGSIESVYVDGRQLKSTGILHDNPLGRAVFKSLCDDLYNKKSGIEKDPVRISIGFLDLEHSHVGQGMDYKFTRNSLTDICPMCSKGIGGKKYLKGVLVHEAFTRVPVNPRTEAEVMRAMSDIKTKKDDAESIVGELSESLVDKSQVGDILTTKSDGLSSDTESDNGHLDMGHEGAAEYENCYDPDTGEWNQDCIDRHMAHHFPKLRYSMQLKSPAHEPNEDDGKTASTVARAGTKSEGDGGHPASHYLVVEDAQKPSTWHLRVKNKEGKIDTRLLGAAHAALTKGFRGNKYEGPKKGEALSKLRNYYKTAGLQWPEEEKSTMPNKAIPEAQVPGNPKVMEPFKVDEDEFYDGVPSNEESINPGSKKVGLSSPAGEAHDSVQTERAKPYPGKETPEEEKMEEEDGKKEKNVRAVAKNLVHQLESLKSQGIMGDEGLRAMQEIYQRLGVEIQRSMTTQAFGGGDLEAIVRSAVRSETEALQRELAVLRAQVGNGQVNKSTPSSRAIRVGLTPFTNDLVQKSSTEIVGDLTSNMTPGQTAGFNQIRSLARKSVMGG